MKVVCVECDLVQDDGRTEFDTTTRTLSDIKETVDDKGDGRRVMGGLREVCFE